MEGDLKKIIEVITGENIKLSDYGFKGIPRINKLWMIYDEEKCGIIINIIQILV